MQHIIPCLWFDTQAQEAAEWYASIFPNTRVLETTYYGEAGFEIHGKPAGSVLTVEFEIGGYRMTALNGGPLFQPTPAISFTYNCDSAAQVDELYEKLMQGGGMALMELNTYPWSERYAWVNDTYGVSWQLMVRPDAQKIMPSLMFVGAQHGRALEAMQLYASIFPHSQIIAQVPYEPGEDKPGIKHGQFQLNGESFIALDSGHEHKFNFTEGVSLQVMCETQEEVDHYWEQLGEGGDPAAQQCGWLKDRFGVSWQVVPRELNELLKDHTSPKAQQVMKALLDMKKLDIQKLTDAYNQG